MVDLEQTEIDALLALIKWEHQDGGVLPQDAGRDAELRSAARKLARPSPATLKVAAARRASQNATEERTLLLAWLTRLLRVPNGAHLAPTKNADTLFPWVVCIHVKPGPMTWPMTWRISDIEASAYFGHLKRHACELPLSTREDKLTRLAAIVTNVKS